MKACTDTVVKNVLGLRPKYYFAKEHQINYADINQKSRSHCQYNTGLCIQKIFVSAGMYTSVSTGSIHGIFTLAERGMF